VGPSMASTTAFCALPVILKLSIFLPFATMTFDAVLASAAASLRPSFALAEIVSLGSMPCASRNLDALVQLVQPLRW
jgi:hypothetical protein